MLALESALSLFRKYDFNSTTSFPYLFSSNERVGLVFLYYDDDYGTLQRAKFFDNEEILEDFLKKYRWFLDNGLKNNVRMILDNYEVLNPHVVFLRNNITMVKGEMFDLEGFRLREEQINQLDPTSRAIFEAGNLLLVYDAIKSKQISLFDTAKNVNNQLRQLYFDLQKEVDLYNGIKLDRDLVLQKKSAVNQGINELMEVSIKDRYNQYRTTPPTLEEANAFVQEVWDLLRSLEVDSSIYQAEASLNNMRGEMESVQKKYNLVKSLNQSDDKFHKVDLIKSFRNINFENDESSIILDNSYVNRRVESIKRKYSYINILNFYMLDNYLKECMINKNYDAVALKYIKNAQINGYDTAINAIASDIFKQYSENINVESQAMLILYNSMYRKLFDLVLDIPDFISKTNDQILDILNKDKNINNIKLDCYEYVKKGFLNPVNQTIQKQLFNNVNFETYENFMFSMIEKIRMFKKTNKILLKGNVKLFFLVKNMNEFLSKKNVIVTNDINYLKKQITSSNNLIGVSTLYRGTSLLYSPYYVDFDLQHDKSLEPVYTIKELGRLELLIQKEDVNTFVDDTISYVNEYTSNPTLMQDITIVSELNLVNKLNYCKVTFAPKDNVNIANNSSVEKEQEVVNDTSLEKEENIDINNKEVNNSSDEIQEKEDETSIDNKEQENEEKRLKVEIKISDNPYSENEFPKTKDDIDKDKNDGGNE